MAPRTIKTGQGTTKRATGGARSTTTKVAKKTAKKTPIKKVVKKTAVKKVAKKAATKKTTTKRAATTTPRQRSVAAAQKKSVAPKSAKPLPTVPERGPASNFPVSVMLSLALATVFGLSVFVGIDAGRFVQVGQVMRATVAEPDAASTTTVPATTRPVTAWGPNPEAPDVIVVMPGEESSTTEAVTTITGVHLVE